MLLFPLFLHWSVMKWWDQMPWSWFFSMLSCKSAFSLSSFTFIERLFSSSLSAIMMVSSAYLVLLLFFPAILIQLELHPVWHFTWCTLTYSFPILKQSVVPCPVLTVASWPAYRFLRRQVRWSGTPISSSIFHSLLWCTQSKALL